MLSLKHVVSGLGLHRGALHFCQRNVFVRRHASKLSPHKRKAGYMGKNKKQSTPDESHLSLPALPDSFGAPVPIIDTHTHLLATFSSYKSRYPTGKYNTVWDFARGLYGGRNVEAIVDVWCEVPVQRAWKELADSALSAEDRALNWGGIDYWFVMGVHPHNAALYDDGVEQSILEAMVHPRCVGWGEIGLDYHYDNSPRDIQQRVFARQLCRAIELNKPLTIHTREAEEDTERILKQYVPVDHKIHIHCFTDSPAFAHRLLRHFPNLYIGITGVISYATNLNTASLVQQMAGAAARRHESNDTASDGGSSPRILLETDAPYMVPSNIYTSLLELKGKRLPLCHTAMIPWVAEFTAGVIGGGGVQGDSNNNGGGSNAWTAADVMQRANGNARTVYGI